VIGVGASGAVGGVGAADLGGIGAFAVSAPSGGVQSVADLCNQLNIKSEYLQMLTDEVRSDRHVCNAFSD
jgi:hypothetical protein